MKKNKVIVFGVIGLALGVMAYLFGNFDSRDGMSVEDSLVKARKAKAAKKAEKEAGEIQLDDEQD